MKFWKTAAFSAALVGAAGVGAAVAPVAHGQEPARVTSPRAVSVFTAGSGGRIGVSVTDIEGTDTKATSGVVIESVDEDSPAARAGLKQGDVVVEFDGERVRSVRQFTRLVSETPAGRQVAATVMRNGDRVAVTVTPEAHSTARIFQDGTWRSLERLRDFSMTVPPIPARPARPAPVPRPPALPDRPAHPAPPPPPPTPRAPRAPFADEFVFGSVGHQLGVTVNTLSDQLAEYFGTKNGVLVTAVTENSAAAKAGVRAGDVIVSINGESVEDAGDLRREMQSVKPGSEFTLNVVRDRKQVTLKGTAEQMRDRRWTARTIL